jgi:hypothetical protein
MVDEGTRKQIPFRLDEDEVECSNYKCPQNDGGVCIESREDCKRRVLEENKWDTPITGIGRRRFPPRPSER